MNQKSLRGVGGTSARTLEVVVVDRTQGFAALEKEWEELYQNSPLATPFQSWSWLYSWWESYGEDYQLRLITLRDEDDLLVGIVPLMLERRWGFERLLFIGTGLTDYNDLLAREGWEQGVSQAGEQALKEMGGWQVIDLQQVRSQAAAWNLFEAWAGPRSCVWQDDSPVIEVRPWEELLASVSRKLRSSARRSLRSGRGGRGQLQASSGRRRHTASGPTFCRATPRSLERAGHCPRALRQQV